MITATTLVAAGVLLVLVLLFWFSMEQAIRAYQDKRGDAAFVWAFFGMLFVVGFLLVMVTGL